MKKYYIFLGVVIVLVILLIWGLVGSSEAAKLGITCDIGMGNDGSAFCWKWHQNIIGDIAQILGR